MMKKSNLWTGIVYIVIGALCLCTVIFWDTPIDSLLCGLAGAGFCGGGVLVWKYFHWNASARKAEYAERLEQEKIEQHDELKEHLRDRSGRIAYVVGLLVIAVAEVAFYILGAFGIIEGTKIFVLFLAGYLVFQVILGLLVYRHLFKKY